MKIREKQAKPSNQQEPVNQKTTKKETERLIYTGPFRKNESANIVEVNSINNPTLEMNEGSKGYSNSNTGERKVLYMQIRGKEKIYSDEPPQVKRNDTNLRPPYQGY